MTGIFGSKWGGDERHIPLIVKYETSHLWPEVKSALGIGAAGAAIAVALYEASMMSAMTSYSRSKEYYAKRQAHPVLGGYRKLVGMVDAMEAADFIENFRQAPGVRGWQSSMRAKPELVSFIGNLLDGRDLPIARPNVVVFLRDGAGRPLELPKTRAVSRLCKGVGAVNEAVLSVDARQDNGVRLTAPVARIFNADFSRGGRHYAMGTSWQNIPKEERTRISIDGEPVAELDYATLHPAILYAQAGATMPADCYAIGDWPRPLVKIAVLVLLNAPNIHSARMKIADCEEMAAFGREGQAALAESSRLIAEIKAAHRPIAHNFHTDAGARLMRIDSDLARDVMHLLNKRGIVALPVHDSFLVKASERDELEAAMHCAAHEIGLRVRVENAI